MHRLGKVENLPLILGMIYCFLLFYAKAFFGGMLSIGLIDGYEEYLLSALIFITVSLSPVFLLLFIFPFFKLSVASNYTNESLSGGLFLSFFCVLVSVLLIGTTFYIRGASSITDVYGNRLLLEHGLFAPLTIIFTPFLIAVSVISALRPSFFGFLIVIFNAVTWGWFFSKGFILVYTLMIYFGLRNFHRNRSHLRTLFVFASLIFIAVLLGRLRSGEDFSDILGISELELLLMLVLHRVDQLDSFVLVMAHNHLDYSLSLVEEIIDSFLYMIPRFILENKPDSFSVEMTKSLRPAVYEASGANNFTIFAQFKMLFGWYAPLFVSIALVTFFAFLGFVQRLLFRTKEGFLIFALAMVLPCFMTIISSGIFRDYILFQILYSLIGIIGIHMILYTRLRRKIE